MDKLETKVKIDNVCDSCGIGIGPDFMEREKIKIGNVILCLTCKEKLKKTGFLRPGQDSSGYFFWLLKPMLIEVKVDKDWFKKWLDIYVDDTEKGLTMIKGIVDSGEYRIPEGKLY